MRYTKTICILLLSVLAMTSCKEFFEMADVDDEVLPTSITISRGNFSIMEGDQFVLHAQSDVDSLLYGYFWQSSDESVVRMVGDTVVAVGPGIATVKVVSARKQLTAIIDVTVVQQWQVSPYDFAREMMVYADVTVKGQKANESILVGAFSNGELRGVGELCQVGSRQYVQIRVYGAGYTEGGSGTEVIIDLYGWHPQSYRSKSFFLHATFLAELQFSLLLSYFHPPFCTLKGKKIIISGIGKPYAWTLSSNL